MSQYDVPTWMYDAFHHSTYMPVDRFGAYINKYKSDRQRERESQNPEE